LLCRWQSYRKKKIREAATLITYLYQFCGLVIDGHGTNHLQIAQINLPYPGEKEKKRVKATKIYSTVGEDLSQ
jgi:hypothetical protein